MTKMTAHLYRWAFVSVQLNFSWSYQILYFRIFTIFFCFCLVVCLFFLISEKYIAMALLSHPLCTIAKDWPLIRGIDVLLGRHPFRRLMLLSMLKHRIFTTHTQTHVQLSKKTTVFGNQLLWTLLSSVTQDLWPQLCYGDYKCSILPCISHLSIAICALAPRTCALLLLSLRLLLRVWQVSEWGNVCGPFLQQARLNRPHFTSFLEKS